MRTLRGTKIIESGCLDPDRNIFYSEIDDGRMFVLRQPRKGDSRKQRLAWNQISYKNRERYRRVNVEEQWLYTVNQRCRRPLYRGEVPGVLPLTVEVDGEVVGFCDAFFRMGTEFKRYLVEPSDLCANFSIIALDKLHGMGIGTLFAYTSTAIARHYGCQYVLGQTYLSGGMYKIRKREGWEVVSTDGKIVVHKMRL